MTHCDLTRRRIPSLVTLTLILLVGAISCAGEPSPSLARAAIRDSSGVHIVEYSGQPSLRRLPLQEVFDYGHTEGDYAFQMVLSGALLPDGGAVVGDMRNSEVVRIDKTGQRASVIAAEGQGPREVRRVVSISVSGQDTVWVEDDGNSKIMLLVQDSLVRVIATQGYELSMGLRVLGRDAGGHFLMTTSSYRPGFDEPWLAGSLVRFDPEAQVVDTVGTYDMAGHAPSGKANPFQPYGVITMAGQSFVTARTDRPEITWRAPDGAVKQILRWNPAPRYPTDADWQAFRAALKEALMQSNPGMHGDQLEQFLARQADRYEIRPDLPMPLFGSVVGDHAGGVWLAHVLRGPIPGASQYDVVAASGEWVGTVDFPSPVLVLDVRNNRVLVVSTDSLGVEGVVEYEVGAPAAD